jgi:hypothetical protein
VHRQRAERPDHVAGILDGQSVSQRAALGEHAGKPALTDESRPLELVPEPPQLRICRPGVPEHPKKRPGPALDPRLGGRVQGHRPAGVRLLDDRAYRRTLLHGRGGAPGAARHGGLDDRLEQPGLAAERPVDRLHGDARLGGEHRQRRARIAAITKQPAGRGQDVVPGGCGLGGTVIRAVAAPGLDFLGHFMRIAFTPIR